MSAAERMAIDRGWTSTYRDNHIGEALGERYGFSNIVMGVTSKRVKMGIWDQNMLVQELGWCPGLWIRPWARMVIDVTPETLYLAFGRREP